MAILSAQEVFMLMNHPVLPAGLLDKLDYSHLLQVPAAGIFTLTKAIQPHFPLQHWYNPSKYTAYRDARLALAKVHTDTRYTVSLRAWKEYKIAVISRVKVTAPSRQLADYAADRWPVNNRILADWIATLPVPETLSKIPQLKEVITHGITH